MRQLAHRPKLAGRSVPISIGTKAGNEGHAIKLSAFSKQVYSLAGKAESFGRPVVAPFGLMNVDFRFVAQR
jgi:hypothetical protein